MVVVVVERHEACEEEALLEAQAAKVIVSFSLTKHYRMKEFAGHSVRTPPGKLRPPSPVKAVEGLL
jgi:hypothetical protein